MNWSKHRKGRTDAYPLKAGMGTRFPGSTGEFPGGSGWKAQFFSVAVFPIQPGGPVKKLRLFPVQPENMRAIPGG